MSDYTDAHEAISDGDVARLTGLLDASPDLVRARDDWSNTLLHHAAAAGSVAMIDALLDAGAEVDARANLDGTPLQWAAAGNHVPACQRLVDAGASLETSDGLGEGGTALVQALYYGHVEAATMLAALRITPMNLRVAAGIGRIDLVESFFNDDGSLKPDAGVARTWYRPHDEVPEKPTRDDPQEILDEALVYACFNRQLETARALLAHGADPAAKPHWMTALHAAVATSLQPLVELIVETGVDLSIRDDCFNSNAAGWAEWGGNEGLHEYLLERGADQNLLDAIALGDLDKVAARLAEMEPDAMTGPQGREALLRAIEYEHDEIVDRIRAAGAALDLGTAARLGQIDDVRRCLESGTDPNATFEISIPLPGQGAQARPMTPLLAAAIGRHHAICDCLIQAGADVDPYAAAALDRVDTVMAALDGGHPVNEVDALGRTLLHRAIQGHAHEAARRLLERGADVDASADFYSFGRRAIHIAAESGADGAMLDLLIRHGADVNDAQNPGTPLECAQRYGYDETAALLRERGAEAVS